MKNPKALCEGLWLSLAIPLQKGQGFVRELLPLLVAACSAKVKPPGTATCTSWFQGRWHQRAGLGLLFLNAQVL